MNISCFLLIPGTHLYLHTTCLLLYQIAVGVVLSPSTELKGKVTNPLSPLRVSPWKCVKTDFKKIKNNYRFIVVQLFSSKDS